MTKVFDGISAEEFDKLMNEFIDREDPDALSPVAMDEAVRLKLAHLAATRVEVTGHIREGQIVFDPPPDAPIMTNGNELIIGGLHLVVHLRKE